MPRFARILFHALFGLILLAGALWSATALWLHLTGTVRILALILLACAVLATAAARIRKRRFGWIALGLTALVVAGWYQTITPLQDRDWAQDVSRGVRAEVDGSRVTLSDLRDFDWQSPDTATPRWITQTYDLDQLETVEMVTSVWDSPDIAHLLVSFGFADGEHVVYSVEIRREQGESFNEIGGFFRQFELVLIAATEQDILRLRTDQRGEQVSLYPVDLTPEQRRDMFLSYVGLAQSLEREPRFYNTIAANCTTVVYGLARSLKSDLPVNEKLILSGRLPEYLHALGVLGGTGSLADRRAAALLPAHVTPRFPGQSWSDAIRGR